MKKLVILAQNKNPDAFAQLIHTYKNDMYRFARSYLSNDEDIADAIQDTILIVYEKLPTLKNPDYFKTWLIRILINKCIDLLKSGKRYVPMENIPEISIDDSAQANIEFLMLMDALDERYSIILILYYSEGYSVKEISKILNLTESAVKARLKRGREKVKSIYELKETEKK